MINISLWFQWLRIAIFVAIGFSTNCAIAQVSPDGTLPTNVKTQGNTTTIEGGTQAGRNLFHSFKEFSVRDGTTAEFNNTNGVQNIISRVTGNSVSNIEGIIKAKYTANLFLINPNGIVFGPNASLQIGGSFIASTASSLNFADGIKFSATDTETKPLLTVSVPIGLQFGATPAFIRNQSQANNSDGKTKNIFNQPVGLQVKPGKTLALVGGDITLEGGNLTASSGRIELGSVASNSLVSLKQNDQNWMLGYEGVQNFQNIRLNLRNSQIPSQVDASGESGGSIQLWGNSVELTGSLVRLISQTTGNTQGQDINITSSKFIVSNGAQVLTSTIGTGKGGNLTVNASESVDLIGSSISPIANRRLASSLASSTFGKGDAGDVTIKTTRFRIQDGAQISAESSGIRVPPENLLYQPAKGNGGNITVIAAESVEITGNSANPSLVSQLVASTRGSGSAGNLNITTGQLIIRNGNITVSSEARKDANYQGGVPVLGKAGELNIITHSILLDDGEITSNSESGKGGNIGLQVRNLLLMRRNSQISTNAGANGDGGKITIYAPKGFLVATPLGNNDITANANFGSGGKILITAKTIFGFVPRTRTDLERLLNTKDPDQLKPSKLQTSDITAFSQQNPSLNGTVQINSPDADPSKGLVELPVNLVDASQQIAAGCGSGSKIAKSSFIMTGRGGLIADPTQPLIADDVVLADWIALEPEIKNRASGIQKRAVVQVQRNTEKSQKVDSVNEPTQIVEAQGWVMDANGNVVLVAQVPTASPHNSLVAATSCAAH
ncbi:MAG: filamentous hemagglutinin N-terminal domain-containing protein [Nostoc sp. DedVER02]|uniref:two-partner secretion domain-containing protein n=1 Tax=unclassified Nostoc TaxID=2593658 RepID=UPI002AD589BB|nr:MULTISPECIES: filamentous hemagglutinin N-terminal domain-containing protein [unclassified Nostoc]MDZ7984902.1 filamentous hemagglutinin N-terminal domain-containing protein [Nostoc sp. DedVER02]MDZ8111090.1 filamentous hemagglutinin N-terminal domain-containing protein [Nostoc sp. DedVER01b]